MSILEYYREHPVKILMAFAGCLLFGGTAFFHLPVEELPEMPIPVIRVVADFPGYPPEEMQQIVTIPLENALSGVKGLRRMEALSKNGTSSITLHFQWDCSLSMAAMEVREAVDGIYPFLPDGVKKPVVFTDNLSDKPVMTLVCIPERPVQWEKLYIPLKYELTSRLKSEKTVGLIRILGIRKPEVHVDVDLKRLYGLGQSIEALASFIGQFLIDQPAGRISNGKTERLLHLSSGISQPEQIGSLPAEPDSSLKIKDIAAVSYGIDDPTSLFLYQGMPALGIDVYKSSGSGTLQTTAAIQKILPGLNREFESLFKITVLDDASVRIRSSLRSLIFSLILGLTSACLVLFLIYRNIPIAIITALSIPTGMILLFFPLSLCGISLNLVSLLGMVIGIGLIVDNSIIVLEQLSVSAKAAGNDSVSKICPAVVSSTVTTVLVFLPPLFFPGLISLLFHDLILTLSMLVIISALTALFWTPALFSKFMHRPLPAGSEPAFLKILRRFYLRWMLYLFYFKKSNHPGGIGLFILCLLVIPAVLKILPLELFPQNPEHRVICTVVFPGDWSFKRIEEESIKLSRLFLEHWNPQNVYSSGGYDRDSLREKTEPENSPHIIRFELFYQNPAAPELLEELRVFLNERGFENFRVSLAQNSLSAALGDTEKVLSLPEKPVLRFVPDQYEMNASGLTASDFQQTIGAAVRGISAGDVSYGREKIPVRVRADDSYRKREGDLEEILIQTGNGFIPLGEIADFTKTWEAASLVRVNRGAVSGSSDEPGSIEFLKLYLFVLVLMFLILGIQSGSAGSAGILMACLPLSLTGSLVFLFFFGYSLNVYGFIGILIMQGTVVNSGILILDNCRNGESSKVLLQSVQRFRSVWATVLTTLAALIPVLISSLASGLPSGAMAAAVMGGMIIGTPLILVFIPLLHHLFLPGRRN